MRRILVLILLLLPAAGPHSQESGRRNDWQRVIVRAEDSLELQADLFLAPGGAGPLCILLHDRGSEGSALRALATGLQAKGIHVLLPDLRGHGSSVDAKGGPFEPGQRFDAGVLQILTEDLLRFGDFLGQQSLFPDSGWAVVAIGESARLGLEHLKREGRIDRLALLSPLLPDDGQFYGIAPPADYLLLACDQDEQSREDLVRLYLMLPEGSRRMDLAPCRSRGDGMLRQHPELIEKLSGWLLR